MVQIHILNITGNLPPILYSASKHFLFVVIKASYFVRHLQYYHQHHTLKAIKWKETSIIAIKKTKSCCCPKWLSLSLFLLVHSSVVFSKFEHRKLWKWMVVFYKLGLLYRHQFSMLFDCILFNGVPYSLLDH